MNAPHRYDAVVSDVAVVLAPPHQERAGLLAYATVIVGGWRVSNIRVRRSADGAIYVSFPEHQAASGIRDPYAVPIDGEIFAAVRAAAVAEYLRMAAKAGRRTP